MRLCEPGQSISTNRAAITSGGLAMNLELRVEGVVWLHIDPRRSQCSTGFLLHRTTLSRNSVLLAEIFTLSSLTEIGNRDGSTARGELAARVSAFRSNPYRHFDGLSSSDWQGRGELMTLTAARNQLIAINKVCLGIMPINQCFCLLLLNWEICTAVAAKKRIPHPSAFY